jgi:acetyl esterase/lipase
VAWYVKPLIFTHIYIHRFLIEKQQITGASDHIPWYSQSLLKHAYRRKAITIAPDYPLGPEANYHDIYNAVRDFLNFYTKDGCFVPGETRWTEWLKKEIGKQIVIDKEDILIDGESAGGHVAVTAIFMNASRDQGFGLRIKAAMLRYPMIKHYTRLMPNEFSFMGEVFTEEDMYGYAKQLKDEIEKLETLEIGSKIGFVRMRSKGCAPQYMWAAPLLSLTGEWKGLFQRVHGKTHTQQRNELWSWDCVERVSELHSQVTHGLLPAIIMHHGVDDANCPFKDTEEFKNRLHELYASRYPSLKSEDDKDTDERVHLIPVRELTEQDGVKGKHSAQVGHGYDYWQENESFQITCFKLVDKYWPKVS